MFDEEYQQLVWRYQSAWHRFDWVDSSYVDEVNAEITAAMMALDAYIKDRKKAWGYSIHTNYYTPAFLAWSSHQVS
ncbi:MAG: hypothetical protein OWS74_06140 [Firmicutes bacterium]|nr:hypothetical protein [Bacillota bacterium]